MSTIIKSGTLITAAETITADIHIEDEKIVAIGDDLNIPDAQVIDALGKLVMPGGIYRCSILCHRMTIILGTRQLPLGVRRQ